MKRIKVIFTGGTISTTANGDTYDVSQDGERQKQLIDNFQKANPELSADIEFTDEMPISVLSENMSIANLNDIIIALKLTDFNAFDGLIITHGTDTLAFTASILSIVLSGVRIPVVMVSANYPLDDERSNGNANFKMAVDFIDKCNLPGVFVAYRNSDSRSYVHLGSRIQQCDRLSDNFYSGKGLYLCESDISSSDGFSFNTKGNITAKQLIEKADGKMLLDNEIELCPSVLILHPYVGLDYNLITIDKKVRYILHTMYHSGTVCTNGTNSIENLVKNNSDKLIFCCSNDSKSVNYSSKTQLSKNRITVLEPSTYEACYAKLLVADALFKSQIDCDKKILQFMKSNLFFEYI